MIMVNPRNVSMRDQGITGHNRLPSRCRPTAHAAWGPPAADFVARPGDELTVKTLPVFFGVLDLLACAGIRGITTLATRYVVR
jgi:hypothetical protein